MITGAKPPGTQTAPTEAELAADRATKAEGRADAADATLREVLARQTPPGQPAPTPAAPKKPEPMPDPATDPQAFESWLARRDQAGRQEVRQEIAQTRDQAVGEARGGQLITEFLAAYPKYTGMGEDVKQAFIAEVAAQRLQALPDDGTALCAAVTKRMEATHDRYAASDKALAGGAPDPKQAADAAAAAAAADDATRTGGVSSGSAASASVEVTKTGDEEASKPLLDVIRDRQAASGFF